MESAILLGVLRAQLNALYYVCLFLISFFISPPVTRSSYLGLVGDLVIVLVCAFPGKLH